MNNIISKDGILYYVVKELSNNMILIQEENKPACLILNREEMKGFQDGNYDTINLPELSVELKGFVDNNIKFSLNNYQFVLDKDFVKLPDNIKTDETFSINSLMVSASDEV